MNKLDCHIIARSDNDHLQQIYTGFALLHHQGIINLQQTVEHKPLGKFEESHLRVILNKNLTLYYDMHDCGEILPPYLEDVDFYFKRSFSAEKVSQFPEKDKIFPFGFNYLIYKGGFDRFAGQKNQISSGKR
jgi:hypothetical protein